jgi:hypothetical protein
MLGAGETVIGQTNQFVSDPACRGLYIPTPAARRQFAGSPEKRLTCAPFWARDRLHVRTISTVRPPIMTSAVGRSR